MDNTLTELARAIALLKVNLILFGFLGFLLGICFTVVIWLIRAKVITCQKPIELIDPDTGKHYLNIYLEHIPDSKH